MCNEAMPECYYMPWCCGGRADRLDDDRKWVLPCPCHQLLRRLAGVLPHGHDHHTSLLLKFMSSIQNRNGNITVALCFWVKNPYIEKGTFPPPQNPQAWMSALASSCQLTDLRVITSPLSDCRSGSTATSQQTLDNISAVILRRSLRRTNVKPPCLQIIDDLPNTTNTVTGSIRSVHS